MTVYDFNDFVFPIGRWLPEVSGRGGKVKGGQGGAEGEELGHVVKLVLTSLQLNLIRHNTAAKWSGGK